MSEPATITEIIGARYETVFEVQTQTFVTEFAPVEGFVVTEFQVPGLQGAKPTDEELIALIEPLVNLAADAYHVHTQISAATVWAVTHSLNKKPAVSIIDSGGNLVRGDVDYIDNSSLTISFSAAFGGEAHLS